MTDLFMDHLTEDAFACVVWHLLDRLFPLGERGVEHPKGNLMVAYGYLPGVTPPPSKPNCVTIPTISFVEVAEQHTLFVPHTDESRRPTLEISALCRSGVRFVHALQYHTIKHLARLELVSKSLRARILPLWKNIYWYTIALFNDIDYGFYQWIVPAYTMPLHYGQSDSMAPTLDIRDPEWFRLAVRGLCSQWPAHARKHIDMEAARSDSFDDARLYIDKTTYEVLTGYALRGKCRRLTEALTPAIFSNYYTLWDTPDEKWEYAEKTEVAEAVQRYEAVMENETAIQDELLARASISQHCD